MARIALRAYNREIERLIEGGQIEEAIAHCRHIFKYFPKHINTYRLLGKAYLETQRYGDAADILQRVLSSIPDDFISHLGMSIIREDEGNLDEAIWHMERAFEVQPANRAIQDELRRLYGRRDGLEPVAEVGHRLQQRACTLKVIYIHRQLQNCEPPWLKDLNGWTCRSCWQTSMLNQASGSKLPRSVTVYYESCPIV